MPPQVAAAGHVDRRPEHRFHSRRRLFKHTTIVPFIHKQRKAKKGNARFRWRRITRTWENNDELESESLELSSELSPASKSWGDLRLRKRKKPARVAERNMRINLSGHIFFFFLFFSTPFLPPSSLTSGSELREKIVGREEMIIRVNQGSVMKELSKLALENWGILNI